MTGDLIVLLIVLVAVPLGLYWVWMLVDAIKVPDGGHRAWDIQRPARFAWVVTLTDDAGLTDSVTVTIKATPGWELLSQHVQRQVE